METVKMQRQQESCCTRMVLHRENGIKLVIKTEAKKIGKNVELLKKVCLSVTNRVQECTDANGGPFEQNR